MSVSILGIPFAIGILSRYTLIVFKGKDNGRIHAIAEEYCTTAYKDKQSAKYVLVIAPTHTEGDVVTSEIRQQLKERGAIGEEERSYTVLKNRLFTEAEKQQPESCQAIKRQSSQITLSIDSAIIMNKWNVSNNGSYPDPIHVPHAIGYRPGIMLEFQRTTKKACYWVAVLHLETTVRILMSSINPGIFWIQAKAIKINHLRIASVISHFIGAFECRNIKVPADRSGFAGIGGRILKIKSVRW